jgi:predicted extracellular nuclease
MGSLDLWATHPPMLISTFRSGLRIIAAVVGTVLLAGPLAAQVALGSGTYTQTFDGIGSGGLPTGWTVYTGATATALGNPASLATAASSWASTTGQWQNSASATGMTGAESVTVQNASTNRVLAIRQSGAFGDPGASATFNFSTVGVQVTSVSFTAQMLNVQARSTTWSLQYGLGATPASWTTIATYTDPGVFGSTTVTGTGFGTALDNQANVRLRIVALSASTGANSRDMMGIENFTIVTTSGGGPVPASIATSPSSVTVTEGANVQFKVVASGTAPFTYQWRKGTTPLSDGGNITGSLTDTLQLSSVTLGDAGNYNAVVTNAGGNATSADGALTVNPAIQPVVLATPLTAQVAPLGGSATFTVGVTGTGPFTYAWTKDGSPLSNGGNISGAASGSLTVNPVGSGDVGNYKVVVTNSLNSVNSTAALSLAATVTPAGAISYAGGSYTQNFDSLPSAGTFTLAGNGPISLAAAPIGASGLGGWSLLKYAGTGTLALFRVDNGGSTSGGIDSYGLTGAGDRALGSLASGSTVSQFGAVLTNSTGRTITQFTLSYAGEQWRRGTTSANTLTFDYSVGGGALNLGTFTAASSLNFTSPNTTGTGVTLDGNQPGNRAQVTATVSGITWAPGQTLVLRWTDIDDSGSDDGLGVDDLTFSTPVTTNDLLPSVVYTTPGNDTANIPTNSAVTVAFNEAVNVSPASFTLSGDASGSHAFAVSGGPTTFTLAPTVPFAEGEIVTLTVSAAQVTDAATAAQHPGADYTASFITFSSAPLPIHNIQGSGLKSAYAGYPVTLQGVVVANFQAPGKIGGYYLEAPDAEQDANPATSEGIYIFDNTNSVTVGDLVKVTGTVTEFLSSSAPASMTQTEISGVTSFTVVSSGNALPTPAPVTLPFASSSDAERYEGMLVSFPQTLTVNDNFDLGHFGEISLANGRLPQPTNIVAPGAPAQAQAAANLLNQILLDDGASTSYPSPTPFLDGADPVTATRRAGSTTAGATGILDTRFGLYVLEPTASPVFTESNPRLPAPASSGSLRVVFGNVENFMNGDGAGGGFPTSRGASTASEFQRQLAKVTAAILSLAPDIMGVSEMENDRITNGLADSYGPTSALAQLVANLNAHAPAGTTYAYINGGTADITTDLIHSVIIYRTETVEPVGAPAFLDNVYFNNHARNPIAQTFREKATGGKFTLCVNHFRAKAGASSMDDGTGLNNDQGDGQGTNNYIRTKESLALTAWLATDPTGSGDARVLIVGDLNSYSKENPITALEGAGYVNLAERFEGDSGYSYAFDGQFGHLDHALATPALNAEVLSTATWHANSDEPTYYDYTETNKDATQAAINQGTPYRYSDHDPVVIGLSLTSAPTITQHPVSQTVTVGNPVTFTATATGTPAPTYQWRFNGTPIGGATAATLTLASPVTADAGSYDVVITNSAGAVASNAAILTVNKATAVVTLGDLAQTYSGTARVASATTTPAGLGVTLTYNGSATPPVNVGSYPVEAKVVDANYVGTGTGTLVVSPATASVVFSNLTQTYDGTPRVVSVVTAPAGLAVALTYNGSAAAPINVGSYALAATVNDANYIGSATNTLIVSPATATVTLGNLFQQYDGTPKSVTVTTAPAGLNVTLTYDGSPAAPSNPGAHAVVATVNEANYIGSANGTLQIDITALVRHLDALSGGIHGSVQVTTGEAMGLNGNAWLSGNLLVPGTPDVRLNGKPTYAGTNDGTGAVTPAGYQITLNGNSTLQHVVRRTDPLALPTVAVPPSPTGTRDVSLSAAGQSAGDFSTIRHLTLNGNAGQVTVPGGTYGRITVNGSSGLVLGVAGATTPSVYNLQGLTLNGNGEIKVIGPVVINVGEGPSLNGSMGNAGHPEWLELNVASGGVTLNGNVIFDGYITAPSGTVVINANSVLNGGIIADRLTVNGKGTLIEVD